MKPEIAFFVTGQGRSGTKWLAQVLDCDPQIKVWHEAGGRGDDRCYESFYRGAEATNYLQGPRMEKIREIMSPFPQFSFGEVNSFLRYCVPELKKVYKAPVVGLVRNGREVIRSMERRGLYASRSSRPKIWPRNPEALAEWKSLSPFAKICWYWADAYRLLTLQIRVFRLKDLNRDFEIFRELCRELGAQVEESDWRRFAGRRIHQEIPADEPIRWDRNRERLFLRFAGDVQEYFGYS